MLTEIRRDLLGCDGMKKDEDLWAVRRRVSLLFDGRASISFYLLLWVAMLLVDI